MLAARPSPSERRRHRRAPVRLHGALLARDTREYPVTTKDVSAGGARLHVGEDNAPLEGGAVLWLDQLGRLPGRVVRTENGDVSVAFDVGAGKRERIADTLTWLLNAELFEENAPQPARALSAATIATPDNDDPPFLVTVLGMTMTGAQLACAEQPPPCGSWVRIGMTWGRVSAHTSIGFDLDFENRR